MADEADDKQNQEYEETDLSDAGSCKGNCPEAEQSCKDRDYQEYERPVKHRNLLLGNSEGQPASLSERMAPARKERVAGADAPARLTYIPRGRLPLESNLSPLWVSRLQV
jgi:hypothetical protein